ncbi:MAG: hypothetical protein DBY04_06220 [Clostridiales bacterium]|nr:MAG: hypothetical protein DBY04_06220 [Clostridiales bacterium]
MDKLRRIISFCLALVILLGMVITPSPINAATVNNKINEVSYRIVDENGKQYKECKLTDLVDINATKVKKNNQSKNTIIRRRRSVGDLIPDADNYQVKVNWTAWSMSPDKLGTEVYFTIWDSVSKKTIAKTDMVTGTGHYKFKKTADWGTTGVSTDRKKWRVRWPNEVRFDIRLITAGGSGKAPAVFQADVTQRAMTLYRAEYYTNSSKPALKVYRRNLENKVKEVDINKDNIGENQYYSFIEKPARVYYEGKTIDVIKSGAETEDSYSCNDLNASQLVQIYTKVPGKTDYDRGPGQFTDNGTPYYYLVTGDYEHPHIVTVRQELKVKFDPNGATFDPAVKTEQAIGHSMKIGETFGDLKAVTVPTKKQISNIPKKDNKDQELVGWVKDEASKGLDFSNGQNADKLVDPNGYEVKDNVTFYAVYAPKAQGKVAIQYVDKSGDAIDNKYKVQGVDYPKFAEGNKGEDVDAKSIPQPAFIGYERSGDIVVTGKKYDENGRYTVEVPYKKLESIIPEKKNGQDNPDVTTDVKNHYAKVTYQVATADDAKAKLQLDNADATSPLVYYVNPVEGIAIKNVANVAAVSKDANLYNVADNDMWTYNPNTITGTDYKIVQAKDTQNKVVKTEITLTAKVADKTAVKFKDKLKPADIKVWEDKTDTNGSKIDWKKGVELKEANADLKTILDKTETRVTDENNRNSSNANLPNGQKGDLKVTFEDGSSLEVKDQTLYVAPHKNDDNTNLPKDAVKVDFKIGEGVTGTAKTEYVKPDTDVKADAPAVIAKEGFKDAKWYKGETTTVATDNDYKVTADSVFTAKATGKDKVVKLDDPENPTNFPKDPTDDSKKDAEYVTVKFVADVNGKIKEGDAEKAKGIAYAVLKNTEWADALTGGVVVPEENATGNAPKLVGKDKFYTFKEWQKDGTKVTEFAKVDADVTYKAVFGKADELTVTYNLNAPEGLTVGGTAPTDTDKYLKEDQVTVKALAADNTLAGYKFTGWNTQADGRGTAYAAGTKFAIKANTELFAQWKKTANDVIPVENADDKKGKNGEEIPDNYVFVDFKVKDDDADKADIKDGQQAKFKVDPKATVTLPAPELELKDDYKKSHNASFIEAEYTNKVFAQATTIFASVTEKGKVNVKYVFETNPNIKTLPDALMALKPEDLVGDKAVYEDNKPADPTAPDTSSAEATAALVEMKDGKKVGEWKFGTWAKKIESGNITYTLTWTFKEVEKPTPPTPPTPSRPSRPSGPSTPSKPESGRVHGKDRVETAIEISKKYFGQANTVIVVDRKDFPDAMTASVLSKLLKAPILLTDTNKLDPRVAAEIQRLGAKDVIVVGGNKSVSEAVKKELAKFDKDTVERIYGRDRYETSAQVARRVVGITGKLGHGVVASGQVFADALTVSPYASRQGYPILLVRANNLPKSVKDAITELAINKVTIAGGYTTVNKSLEASLPTVAERLSGRTRYETAIDIATKKFNTNKIFLANGEHWMDALVIGPVGGILDMPILLTQANSAPQSLKDYIAKERIQKITAIGGTSMVSEKVLNELSK